MFRQLARLGSASAWLSLATLSAFGGPAWATTHEQIVASCRGMAYPTMVACMMRSQGQGDHDARLEQCRQSVGIPFVRACVQRQEQKEAAHAPPPSAPALEDAKPAPSGEAFSTRPTFVAPPRTTADISEILEREKPDPEKIAARQAAADAAAPTNGSAATLSQFYYDRGSARALLGRNQDALSDGLKSLDFAKSSGEFLRMTRVMQFVGLRYRALGDADEEAKTFEAISTAAAQQNKRGGMINPLANLARSSLVVGEITRGEAYARRVEALVQEARGSPNPAWRKTYAVYGNSFEADSDGMSALVLESHGQYAQAEALYRRSEAFRRASVNDLPKYDYPPTREQILQAAETTLLSVARTVAKQGRLSEAEGIARKSLLDILDQQGRYSPATPSFIIGLAGIVVEEGRYKEAESLARAALQTLNALGVAAEAPERATILASLGNILVLSGDAKDAQPVYDQLDQAIASWSPPRKETYKLSGARVAALYAAGQIDAGVAAAEALVQRETLRKGAGSFDAALAHGLLAVGYARSKRDADALREFRTAIPILTTAARENSADDDATVVAARQARLQRVVEAYFNELVDQAKDPNDVAQDTFSLSDAIRAHSVGAALADASARAFIKDPTLAGLVRDEQDLDKQIGASLGALNNLLSLPPDVQRDQDVKTIAASIADSRAKRDAAALEINRRFPAYASLISPKPPTLSEVRAALRPDEAFLSFYFGQSASFVWATTKEGAVAFARLPMTARSLATTASALRKSLEPEVARVEEIPPFDVSEAFALYAKLLAPVERGWKSAKNLIVVTNGALGELPLGLLPTANAQVDPSAQPLFAGYRAVPWLARAHSVTMVPSAAAFLTLRSLPPGAPSRENLIGFGDPYFSHDEAVLAEGELQIADAGGVPPSGDFDETRGGPLKLRAAPRTEAVDKAELAMLPRLPDTRPELVSMAHALDVDPAKALFLGKDANEQTVEHRDLTGYRVVAFATHGLIPGDLDGLTQPALALTAPEVAGVQGDGLLTVDKILALKLDADWVVLSACNTGAGAGAGAEAASGLGSAFFYAGTRALLVTNWSVHSASARVLTSDLFRRVREDPRLPRSEALRLSMMSMVDGPGSVDPQGRTIFTYAHPLFWAPFSVIGDSGGS
jgi:CHAT domain-containing protein